MSEYSTAYFTENMCKYPRELVEVLNAMMSHVDAPVRFEYHDRKILNSFDIPRVGMGVGDVLARDFELVAKRI